MNVNKSLGGDIQYASPLIGILFAPRPASPTYCQVPSNPIIQLPLNLRYKICEMKYILETNAVWKITLILEV